ncbi:hypothetical protein QNH48_16995 [Neobacillus sp. YX16]|nr:hypothetical protein [Neobacillus sp. YX16]WHZ00749.1 hypothetical protein QNH48_16995 [Neobacillus sp. YX16]
MENIGDIINGNLFLYELHWFETYKMEIGIICPYNEVQDISE